MLFLKNNGWVYVSTLTQNLNIMASENKKRKEKNSNWRELLEEDGWTII
jgi:hypothetical protein